MSVSDELNMLIQDPSAPSCLFGAPHTTRFTLDWSRAPAHLREREEDVGVRSSDKAPGAALRLCAGTNTHIGQGSSVTKSVVFARAKECRAFCARQSPTRRVVGEVG